MKPEYELRGYQLEFLESVHAAFKEVDKVLAVMATGGGKTICFAALAEQYLETGGRVLIIAHTDELCTQAIDKIHRATGHFGDLEKAEHIADLGSDLVISSVQTMSRRLDKWPSDYFALVIIDEAHRSTAATYRAVIDHFTSAKIIGVTATGFRSDDAKLFDIYERLATEIDIRRLVAEQQLCPIKIQTIPVQIDMGDVDPDRQKTEAEAVLDRYLEEIARVLPDYIGDRRTIAFLPFKRTAERFASLLTDNGIPARCVHGSIDRDERKRTLHAHQTGQFQVLTNPHMLAEGYDDPSISCVLPLTPTRSKVRYIQQVGRGTRRAPGKDDLLVLDPLYISDRYRICTPADLATSKAEITKAIDNARRSSSNGPLDLFALESDCVRKREQQLARELEAKRHRKSRVFDALEIGSTFHSADLLDYEPHFRWEKKEVTPGQSAVLAKVGIDVTTVTSRGQASAIIDWLGKRRNAGQATIKQLLCLCRNGYRMNDINEWTFQKASETIERIIK